MDVYSAIQAAWTWVPFRGSHDAVICCIRGAVTASFSRRWALLYKWCQVDSMYTRMMFILRDDDLAHLVGGSFTAY